MIDEIRFEIGCKNLSEQVEFYSSILGGEIISNEEGFVVMRIAGIRFALWDATDNKNAQKVGVTMVTNKPDSIKEKLRENRSLVSEWEGCTMFVTADPDGNGITFMEGNSD
ncbi:MAG: VOC family protein [Caldisericia bacterium]